MANQNPFSLVRRLTSTILILLLVLLVIQIAGTLWGRYVVTQELYSSTQNNVNYLRDTFEENVRQIQREMTNQLFYQASPQLITFYTQLRKGAFSTNAHYHWELNQLKLELNVVQQMNAMIDGMDIYFPKLGSALSVSQGAISPNAVADEDIQNVYAAFQGTGFRLTRIDDAFFIPCHYPVSGVSAESGHILIALRLDEGKIQEILSSFNTFSGKNALLYHYPSDTCVTSSGSVQLQPQELQALLTGHAKTDTQGQITLDGVHYLAMCAYSEMLDCSFVQLIPARQISSVPNILLDSTLAFFVAMLTVILLILRSFHKYVNRPVQSLIAAFDKTGQHLIGYFDGAFHLTRSITGKAAGLMTNYGVTYSEDGKFGDNVAGIYSAYKLGLLAEAGWDGIIVSDWGVIEDGGRIWGMEDKNVVERHATVYQLGITQTGGSADVESPVAAYELLVQQIGEEAALAVYRECAKDFFLSQINCGLYENPYIDYDTAQEYGYNSIKFTAEAEAEHVKTIIMLKNEGSVIAPKAEGAEKKTVYIPYIFAPATEGNSSQPGTPAVWEPSTDIAVASKYYNVVTDSVGEPSGPDGTYTENDVIRASAEDLAKCDLAVVSMRAAKQDGATNAEGKMLGGNLQYHGYTPTKAREVSIAGDNGANWSWNGNPIGDDSNIADLYMLEYVKSAVNCPVISVIAAGAPMVMSEVEPLADVILYHFGQDGGEIGGGVWFSSSAVWQIISGEAEPYALLPFQMPASMDAVDSQDEDTIRDVECYVDAAGNTYDFAFGLNWNGLIEDARTAKYRTDPVTKCEYLNFHFANAD